MAKLYEVKVDACQQYTLRRITKWETTKLTASVECLHDQFEEMLRGIGMPEQSFNQRYMRGLLVWGLLSDSNGTKVPVAS